MRYQRGSAPSLYLQLYSVAIIPLRIIYATDTAGPGQRVHARARARCIAICFRICRQPSDISR